MPANPRSNEILAQVPLARGGPTAAVPKASTLEVTLGVLGLSEFINHGFMGW